MKRGWFLYRLLRPELVQRYKERLSSDSFTMFQSRDPEKKVSKERSQNPNDI